MSYTYLQEQGEESSAESFADIPQSVLSKLNLIAGKSYFKGNETESCQSSQSGTMFAPLTGNPGEEMLTSFAEGSHVKTCPLNRQCITGCRGWMDLEVDSGWSSHGSLVKYDPASSLWKTHQISLFEDLTECLETWPRWGIMQDGECWEQIPLGLTTKETGSGWSPKELKPTVLATDYKGGTTAIRKDRGDQRTDQWRDYVKINYGLTYPHPTHSEVRMGWPTEWTALKPLGMDKCQLVQPWHGNYSLPKIMIDWLRKHGIVLETVIEESFPNESDRSI
jgi:hypothetical protein